MTVEATLPEDVEAELNAELDAIDAARGTDGVSVDYLRFSGLVARAQARARMAIRAVDPAGSTAGRRGSGRLLSPDEVPFDDSVLMELLRGIENASKGEGREDHLRSLVAAAEEDSSLLRRLVLAATLGSDARPLRDAAGRLDLPVHALVHVARLLAAPFMVEARHRRGDMPEVDVRGEQASETQAGRCPTCDSAAGLAVLRNEDGTRRLMCLLCGDTWLTPRLMCPSCGTRDQSRLGTLLVAEDDPRWIEVCEACRRYIKTTDQRLLPEGYEVVARAEDARTLHLDMIAEREGYVRAVL